MAACAFGTKFAGSCLFERDEKMKNELGLSPEFEVLRLRREYLRGKCAEEVEEYMHLTTCVGPNLKADYMLRVGQLEHRVFQLKTDVARW